MELWFCLWQGTGVYSFTNMGWRRENYLKSIFLKRILINYTILVWNIGNNVVYNYRYLFQRNMPYLSYENDLKKARTERIAHILKMVNGKQKHREYRRKKYGTGVL